MIEPSDLTEPSPMEIGTTVFEDAPYMYRVEHYLMSKYAPEMVEATIFKVRTVVLEGAKVAKEDHIIHPDLSSLQTALEADLDRFVKWIPAASHRPKYKPPRPEIGSAYQRELDRL